ncbi:YceI family protein [Dermatophilus congolensis]|uniref:YceI family protein n=1 Tax=Dermatophilus congolensis TaxID=1863 RepID=UPI001AAF5E62|nr:YceI family protein [Dermatophilus congolensis]MBO3130148.1 YceI family protein [Dermatophilus congolensis]MBO3131225.1 YceI family protein [Dermatophilus congolensis]MBO3134619.1 YceI family protein [Dermatophilus congolensis]MBO3136856.1 YceI family protein [Dermatophilus congolensis]MBO3139100.1 YceI family protein [Dermatophilus congolensis]
MTALESLHGTYSIDPAHSEIGFAARHAMVTKVRGSFDTFEGTASIEPNLLNGAIEVTIDVSSIDTRNGDRDNHLRSADFFDVEKYPHITFRSTHIASGGSNILRVTGDLTIRDITRTITIDFLFAGIANDHTGAERAGFEGSIKVNRKDFGLTWNAVLEAGGLLVSEEVTLSFDISAVKQA